MPTPGLAQLAVTVAHVVRATTVVNRTATALQFASQQDASRGEPPDGRLATDVCVAALTAR